MRSISTTLIRYLPLLNQFSEAPWTKVKRTAFSDPHRLREPGHSTSTLTVLLNGSYAAAQDLKGTHVFTLGSHVSAGVDTLRGELAIIKHQYTWLGQWADGRGG